MTTNFSGKKIAIFGLGKSGIAAAKKLASLGARVVVTESQGKASFAATGTAGTGTAVAANLPAEASVEAGLALLGVEIEFGGHTLAAIEGDDLIVVSPGVHLDLPVLKEAKKRNIPIISEIELAYQFLSKPVIAVTGTNGKTTTTTLIGEMLRAEGFRVSVAGNIGFPLAAVDDEDLDYIVAEISSYQLETIREFKPWISVILNIQPDHLERHHTMRKYINQKARIFMNQQGDDYVVYNRDDEHVREMVESARAKRIGFSKAEA
ncbi:UDP-N-acetylmuramoyl-L-alanine--D-glutamate ligase, partial [Candidatus Saganbacteria bacterium]|nr:UDP-N-acetylmuramoyl-L-alanine--D-glutamate ligase [Candidatus Saganbacteria bacterium]